MTIDELNALLADYDRDIFAKLEPVLDEMRLKSGALASGLQDCFFQLKASDRYLQAYYGEQVSIKESDLEGLEFDVFRKYVRLLRSCTIMCGQDLSQRFKKLFLDFFSGTRLELAQKLGESK